VALLSDLVEAVADQLRKSGQAMYQVRQMAAPRDPVHPGDDRYHHSYAMWSLFKSGAHPPLGTATPVWRVEEFLGLDRSQASQPSTVGDSRKAPNDSLEADLVVLDDADLGFRDHREWSNAITGKGA
jgi:hypothetical protein